jgi:predicted enzyme related to lactoylglutathione lyase
MAGHHGKFVWYELMTSDAAAAEAFYRGVIGWGARDSGMPGMSYRLLTVGETPVAGMMALPAGAPPGWTAYIAVDNVDTSASQVKQAGGAVYREPADIPGVGRFAVVADPQGAVFSLLQPTGEPPANPPKPGTPGTAGWHELLAADGPAAFDFYSKQFGWTKDRAMDMGPMGVYQLFANGGEAIGGMMTKPPAVPAPFWLYYFNVDAIDAAADRVKAGGGQIANGPHEVPGPMWIVQCIDPQGAMFALVAPKR